MIRFLVLLTLFVVTFGLPTNSSNKNIGYRIVGGEETDIEHNPWQLALLYYGQHFCGGVEIHPLWALTTAHCLIGVAVFHLSIRAGSSFRSSGGQVIEVETMYEHSDFDKRTVDFDFALLKLLKPITIDAAAPIPLPDPNPEVPVDDVAVITGWGLLDSEGEPSEVLRRVEVPVVDDEVCQWAHQQNPITDRMFCAGDMMNGGIDACQGDSGGPAVIDGRLIGLVSWGSGCGKPDTPGVYAKVSSVLEWITRIMDRHLG